MDLWSVEVRELFLCRYWCETLPKCIFMNLISPWWRKYHKGWNACEAAGKYVFPWGAFLISIRSNREVIKMLIYCINTQVSPTDAQGQIPGRYLRGYQIDFEISHLRRPLQPQYGLILTLSLQNFKPAIYNTHSKKNQNSKYHYWHLWRK